MSASSVTACSRSPSPTTPDSSDTLDPALFRTTLQSWCTTFDSDQQMWAHDQDLLAKDDLQPLSFHDLIQEQMFDECVLIQRYPLLTLSDVLSV